MSIKISFLMLMALLMLTACGTGASKDDQISSDAHRFSAITRVDPRFNPEAQQTLAWFDELIVEDQQSDFKVSEQQRQSVIKMLEETLESRNFQFTTDKDSADYLVGAAILLDHSPESQEIEDFVAVHPSLGEAQGKYDKGTLLVAIAMPTEMTQENVLWRGAIQAYTMGDELPEDIQQARFEAHLKRLIEGVPFARAATN